MKTRGTKLGDNFRLSLDGKIVRGEAASLARLDVSKRIARRKSKRIKVAKRVERDFRG